MGFEGICLRCVLPDVSAIIGHHFNENGIKVMVYLPAEFPRLFAIVQCDNPANAIS